MLDKLSKICRKALVGCVAASLPPERSSFKHRQNRNILLALCGLVKMSGDVAEASLLLVCDENMDMFSTERITCIQGYVDILLGSGTDVYQIVANTFTFFVRYGYGARERCAAHNLCRLLSLPKVAACGIEAEITAVLIANSDEFKNMDMKRLSVATSKDSSEPSDTEKLMRYAKIGMVAAGTGAVLALTAGLAAPAIAAGLLVTGGLAGAATFATSAIIGTLFGSAGAGLAGYKMAKRTTGLTEFQFESCDVESDPTVKHRLAVCVMVSGYLTAQGMLLYFM
jgi:hypothetical protein